MENKDVSIVVSSNPVDLAAIRDPEYTGEIKNEKGTVNISANTAAYNEARKRLEKSSKFQKTGNLSERLRLINDELIGMHQQGWQPDPTRKKLP